jgi:quercetin dioxygenase-like cupin family protein
MEKKINEIKKLKAVYSDGRGDIWDVLEGFPARHIGYIVSRKGAVRGNHFHWKATQYLFLLKGTAEWATKDIDDKKAPPKISIIEAGDLAIISPGIAHAFRALEDCECLDITDVSREDNGYEKDIFRVELI